ncbi:Nonribosomal peptide synthetase 12 [Mycena sanguinolenta]|uniref:Nonribosomal peptide synthetase 12 n=1 Tax=Mycena sanguinolenta TaxID=230812 RepID=A0A8H7CSB7_9AGAR|nr:Nonribosomal peptide synthetase 12 [Mycena sanguinolenta]
MDSEHTLDALTAVDKLRFSQLGWGPTLRSPFQCVHHAFAFNSASHLDAIAVEDVSGSDTITFAQLDRQSNCLASRLRDEFGVGPGSRVCLLIERSISMVVGILGILKAGAAYVPCDGKVVSDKALEHILKDSGCQVVITLGKFAHRLSDLPLPLEAIFLDDPPCTCSAGDALCQVPEDRSSGDDSVYVIYTSGTTGIPKGVDVLHRNVTNLVCLAPGNLGMAPGVRVSQLMNIAFDMAAWEILGSLCNGATLVLRGQTSKEWRAAMRLVDIVIGTPSMLAPHNPTDYPNIKTVAVAGEACPRAIADSWAEHTRFYSCCGPTGGHRSASKRLRRADRSSFYFSEEVTIVNTMHLHSPGRSISIGRPTPNNTVYVLDERMNPTPIGVPGIMWAGGECVSRGYLNLPAKTNERYKLDPFTNDGSMMFNTGDLGCAFRGAQDGTLKHLGRIDDQVKIKGFRVELDGVAAAMETTDGIKAAAALLIDAELWGFVTPDTVSDDEVRKATAQIQPYYAVPTHIVALASFPRTGNDKIDKRALRQLASDFKNKVKANALPVPDALPIPEKPLVPLPLVTSRNANKPAVRDTHSSSSSITLAHTMVDVKPDADTDPVPSLPAFLIREPSTGDHSKHLEVSMPSEDSSTVELKQAVVVREPWEGYEKDVLPDKLQRKTVRNLRHIVFSLYRRLFGVVFLTNMGIFISLLIRGGSDAQRLGLITLANLFVAILMRQDYVVNAFFNVFCAVPTSWPLSIRRVCARVYHIGGLHSGCATSGVVWLALLCGQATKEVVDGGVVAHASVATVAVSYSILLLLFGIVIFAYPTIRSKRHDSFERVHRFFGWTSIILVWAQVVLLTNDYRKDQSLSHALVHSAPFWMLLVMTGDTFGIVGLKVLTNLAKGSIILPWLRLRKVPVRAEVLSKHAVRLYFTYSTPIPGSFVRLSVHPLKDWHGFATIAVPNEKGFSLVVSKAGDWTNSRITDAPTHIWVRGAPCFGVLRIVPLFRRLVFVATGSGIGPCAPCVLEQRVPIRLLWTSPNVRETFGDKLVDEILGASPDAVVYDTWKHGKPDMVKLTLRLVNEFNAEAVCVISNQKLTQKIVYGMMSRGIPAFGAIWDS